MRKTLKILNKFGITPTNNYVSAGADFYVPYFDEDKKDEAFLSFQSSYKVNKYDIENVLTIIRYTINNEKSIDIDNKALYNSTMLFFALHSSSIESYGNNLYGKISLFVNKYLTFDEIGTPGIILDLNDTLFINSGIHVALFPGTAGIFLNKSGKGNAGFDVRAQVVDEDYTGPVHLSVAYTKDTNETSKRTIFCGDKLIQMVILPVINCEYVEVTSDEYYEIMSDSERGDNMLGSSDVKH